MQKARREVWSAFTARFRTVAVSGCLRTGRDFAEGGLVESVEIVFGLVVLATVVAAVAGRLSAPAPSLLVLAGLAVGLVPGLPTVRISPDLVTLVVLPPLLYAAGHDLSLRDLRSVWRPVTVLAVGLVLATAAAVAAVAVALLGVSWPVGFVLGAILASTDPVAVTALARTLRLPPRLEALVSAESLFNDATSLVMFQITLTIVATGGGVGWGSAGLQLVRLGAGGVAAGLVVAFAAAAIRRRTHDPVTETVMTLVTPYAAFLFAEVLHVSGVTAVVVTGVAVGALGSRLSSASNRLQLNAVSGTTVFLLESVVFALIGLQLPSLVRALDVSPARWVLPALAVTAAVVLMRALWVFPLMAIVEPSAEGLARWRPAAVATWAGTRGVVPLAAALSIPLTVTGGGRFPERELLLVVAISVCVITLVVQGFTLQPLTRLSGVAEGTQRQHREESVAELALAQAALGRAEQLMDADLAPPAILTRLIDSLVERRDAAQRYVDELRWSQGLSASPDGGRRSPVTDQRTLYREVLDAEAAALTRLLAEGRISEGTWRSLRHTLDLQEAALRAQEG